jgi:hypothetical protein
MELTAQEQKNIANLVGISLLAYLRSIAIPHALAIEASESAGNRAAADAALTVREYRGPLGDIATTNDRMGNKIQRVSPRG